MLTAKSVLRLIITFLVIILTAGSITAQDVKSTLFAETNNAMEQANKINAGLLSPRNYEQAMEFYREAENDYESGYGLVDIRETLKSATNYFYKAIEVTRLAEVTFIKVIAARNDAKDARAPEFALELWNEAEERFRDATDELEDGDINYAKEYSSEAATIYRTAELEAIESHLLAEVRDLLIDAENEDVEYNAPKTLQKAKDLALLTEMELGKDRYDTDNARSLIHQSKYEALHSLYLSKLILKLEDEDRTLEDIILMSEEPLHKIAAQVDMKASLDEGYDKAASQIINSIKTLQDNLSASNQELIVAKQELIIAKQELELLREQLSGIETEKSELSEKMAALQRVKEQFSEVQKIFYPTEAMVFRDEYNVFLRLVGLNFDIGKSDIAPEFYGLLGKVQNAITLFPECTITIEGHTDSQGGDESNLGLSQKRADAVKYYLIVNSKIEAGRINAIGFGESKPIANNETTDGRRKNRRIDVVIHPTGL
jgi:outer membrane protein OmpA-like peptidoglycan-associated protein